MPVTPVTRYGQYFISCSTYIYSLLAGLFLFFQVPRTCLFSKGYFYLFVLINCQRALQRGNICSGNGYIKNRHDQGVKEWLQFRAPLILFVNTLYSQHS